MGVLEARADAEKIGYPVVGEKTKDADNVIDYDIREEITKDVSAEINANNQTTTGMATVIPGVNAPKLLESTSIIPTKQIGYIYAETRFIGSTVLVNNYTDIVIYTISNELGEPKFTKASTRLKVPADGIYKLEITRPFGGYNWYWDIRLRTDLQDIKHYIGTYDKEDIETLTVQLKKGEVISGYGYMRGSTTGVRSPNLYINFTRLGGI